MIIPPSELIVQCCSYISKSLPEQSDCKVGKPHSTKFLGGTTQNPLNDFRAERGTKSARYSTCKPAKFWLRASALLNLNLPFDRVFLPLYLKGEGVDSIHLTFICDTRKGKFLGLFLHGKILPNLQGCPLDNTLRRPCKTRLR